MYVQFRRTWHYISVLKHRPPPYSICQVSHCGGISELRRIASLAEVYDVAIAPHCPLGPIAFAACMQVGIATPNCMHHPFTTIHFH